MLASHLPANQQLSFVGGRETPASAGFFGRVGGTRFLCDLVSVQPRFFLAGNSLWKFLTVAGASGQIRGGQGAGGVRGGWGRLGEVRKTRDRS